MPKLKKQPISAVELSEFLDTSSDFAFELRCLELLSELGFQCQHAGSYVDPITKKSRQVDIRAQKRSKISFSVRLAVECKNLSDSFPLLMMCVPRSRDESFHELILSYDPDLVNHQSQWTIPAFRANCKIIRVDHAESNYIAGAAVGKSSVQVGKGSDNSIIANDAEVFEKWSQALASANDLVYEATREGEEKNGVFFSLVLPILIVPDGTLWNVEYAENGTRSSEPARVDRCSFFIGHNYKAGDASRWRSLTISHLECVTVSGLEDLSKEFFTTGSWFPSTLGNRLPED